MKSQIKILFIYMLVIMLFITLCGCQSKSKKKDDNTINNNIEEQIVSDEQITEDDFDSDIASDNKHNSLDSDSEQSYFNDETSDDETDTKTSNSNTSNNTSKPSTNTGNSKPSTNTQNTQSSTNTNKSEQNNNTNTNTNTNTNNSTPSTSTETSKPTETTPEQPKGTLIYDNVYGCGSEHTKVVRGITFHWYDRYEQKTWNKSIDFTSLDVRFEKETDPLYAGKTNDKFCFDYEATASHRTSVWLRMYDSEGYFLEDILLYINTDHNIQGKSRGTMWCRDINMYIDAINEIYPAYVEIYPAL